MHGKFTVLHVIGKEKVEIMRDKLRIPECSVYVQRSCGPHCASACRHFLQVIHFITAHGAVT